MSLAREPDGRGARQILMAMPTGRGAGSLRRLLGAHAWWQVPIRTEKFLRGARIQVLPVPGSLP